MSETDHTTGHGSRGLTEGDQLGRDLAKAPQALRDGMSCFSGRDVSTALVQVHSRGRVAGGRGWVLLSSFNGLTYQLAPPSVQTQNIVSPVTDAIDGISAGNGAAATDRTDIPARGSSGAPSGGTPAGQLAWETCWPRCGVESGVVVEKSPAQGRFEAARELLKERACACNSSDMEWLISGWALELGCRMNGVLLANCSHSHQPTGLANKPNTCLRPSHFAHPVRVIGWGKQPDGEHGQLWRLPHLRALSHHPLPPSRPRLEPLSRHHP